MGREVGDIRTRARSVLADAVGRMLGLMLPVLVTTAVEAPGGASVTLVAVVLAVLITFGGRHFVSTAPAFAARRLRPVGPRLRFTAEVTDPPHHPLRPRAPGLA
jgi:hypothetical protein